MSLREEKLVIAKAVYKEIKHVMDHWESNKDFEISCCWDGCLWVDDEFFNYWEMEEQE